MTEGAVPALDLERIDAWCREDWAALCDSRIFITGGTGFFGTWLIASILYANQVHRLGLEVTALTRDADGFRKRAPELTADPALKLHAGDVRDFAFPPAAFTHVIHAAAEASAKLNSEQPLAMIDTIIAGTKRTLELAVASRARRYLFVSSGAVYGKQPESQLLMSEDCRTGPDPLDANAAYGEAKRLAEQMCAAVSRSQGLEVVIARCWAFLGPWLPLDTHFAAGNLIRDALHGGPLIIKGDGRTERSYLYAADLAAWLWRILVRGKPLRPYHVGSDQAVSIGQLAHAIAEVSTPRPTVEIRGKSLPGATVDRYVPDVSRARNELGLEVWTQLHDALKMTIAWHRRSDMVVDRNMGQGL